MLHGNRTHTQHKTFGKVGMPAGDSNIIPCRLLETKFEASCHQRTCTWHYWQRQSYLPGFE